MREYEVDIYTDKDTLPSIVQGDFFHSQEFFQVIAKTSGMSPMMAVAKQDEIVVGQLLVVLYRHHSWFPPYIYTHAHAYGEGSYAQGADVSTLFPLLLRAVTIQLHKRLCFYIEFSRLSKKMMGYRHFRKLGYVPIPWQEIHNSLHSKKPSERLTKRQKATIQKMKAKGVSCQQAATPADLHSYHKMLKNFCRFKIRRYVPDENFFSELAQCPSAKHYIVTSGKKTIGGYTCIYNQKDAYLWHTAFKRKSYMHLHPDMMTIWYAIEESDQQKMEHLHFMDAGLPVKSNLYREFILGFGGKPVTKYRWFRFYPKIINVVLQWFYKK